MTSYHDIEEKKIQVTIGPHIRVIGTVGEWVENEITKTDIEREYIEEEVRRAYLGQESAADEDETAMSMIEAMVDEGDMIHNHFTQSMIGDAVLDVANEDDIGFKVAFI